MYVCIYAYVYKYIKQRATWRSETLQEGHAVHIYSHLLTSTFYTYVCIYVYVYVCVYIPRVMAFEDIVRRLCCAYTNSSTYSEVLCVCVCVCVCV